MAALVGALPAQAAFPGLNGKIAFQRDGPIGGGATFTNIFAMEPSGANVAALTSESSVDSSAPAYSADGKRIAFVRDDPSTEIEHIWVMDATGASPTQLTADTNNDSHPAFSPDGTKIAFARDDVSNSSGPDQIWVMDANGQNSHPITSGTLASANPAWSPDGSKIAFSRQCAPACGEGAIFVMGADGSNPTQLSAGGTATGVDGDNYPNWAPDGTKIAFSRDYLSASAGEFIFVMGADGANPTQLTTFSGTTAGAGADDIMPAFSPDGKQIAFRREAPGNQQAQQNARPRAAAKDERESDTTRAAARRGATARLVQPSTGDSFIWTMDANGQNQTQRTEGLVEDQKPDWQPLANVASSASVPACSSSGNISVRVSDPSGFKSAAKALHYRLDGGAEQTAPANGNPGTATISVAQGRHSLEYWGENQVADQQPVHNFATVVVDKIKPHVSILSDQRRVTYRRGQAGSVTITAYDSGAGLTTNPSRRRKKISTSRLGRHSVTATAVDKCGNRASDTYRYRVVAAAIKRAVVVHRNPRFTG